MASVAIDPLDNIIIGDPVDTEIIGFVRRYGKDGVSVPQLMNFVEEAKIPNVSVRGDEDWSCGNIIFWSGMNAQFLAKIKGLIMLDYLKGKPSSEILYKSEGIQCITPEGFIWQPIILQIGANKSEIDWKGVLGDNNKVQSVLNYWTKKYPDKFEELLKTIRTSKQEYDWVFIEELKNGDTTYSFITKAETDDKINSIGIDINAAHDYLNQKSYYDAVTFILKTLHPIYPLSYAKIDVSKIV